MLRGSAYCLSNGVPERHCILEGFPGHKNKPRGLIGQEKLLRYNDIYLTIPLKVANQLKRSKSKVPGQSLRT